uniref:Uncharacterized protein n=1 Tax=Arundo donax TaxID=35708 RepID=A0A0A9EM11_ARUDO
MFEFHTVITYKLERLHLAALQLRIGAALTVNTVICSQACTLVSSSP